MGNFLLDPKAGGALLEQDPRWGVNAQGPRGDAEAQAKWMRKLRHSRPQNNRYGLYSKSNRLFKKPQGSRLVHHVISYAMLAL